MYPSSSPYSVQVPDTHSILIVEFLGRFAIENPQQSPVTLYDYYDPGKHDCVVDWGVLLLSNACNNHITAWEFKY